MCDPVGVVALGIQVCGGLVSYYGSYKSQNESVAHVCTKLESLGATLLCLQKTLEDFRSVEPMVQVARNMTINCQSSLAVLEEQLRKCEATRSQDGFRGRLDLLRRRVLFPFHHATLRELETVVNILQIDLGTALHVLQLYVDIRV